MPAINTLKENKLSQLRSNFRKTNVAFDPIKIIELNKFLDGINLPTTKDEAWKYTRLTKLSTSSFSGESLPSSLMPIESTAYRIVFENGKLISSNVNINYKSIHDLTSKELSIATVKNEVFDALNYVYANDGIYLDISSSFDKPVEIVHISNGDIAYNLRHIIKLNALAKAEISLVFEGNENSKSFSNVVTEIFLEKGAHLNMNKLQIASGDDIYFNREKIRQNRDSIFKLNTITLDGQFTRNDVEVDVEGENAETHLNGVFVINNQQFVDNHTTIDHKVANCQSNELYKGVLFDKATAVFNGKVMVRKDAQKINAFQSNANILMSPDATINAKPELEIYADDVKCSHGSTTGQLDEEAVFYLRSRGISDKAARNLLVSSFIGQVLEHIENDEILARVEKTLYNRFGWE